MLAELYEGRKHDKEMLADSGVAKLNKFSFD